LSFHDIFSTKEVMQKQSIIYLFNYQYVN
jgi:hypothetical protein